MIRSINDPGGAGWDGMTPGSINEPQAMPAAMPTIEGYNPPEATEGEDVFVVVHGTHFIPECYVIFDGGALATTFEAENKINATLPARPAGDYTMMIGYGPAENGPRTPPVNFTFTKTEEIIEEEDLSDPDVMEEEIEAAEEEGEFEPTHADKPKSKSKPARKKK